MSEILAYIAATLIALWSVAHSVPTRQVVDGFMPVTQENRYVILQEWLAEAFTMWGLAGILVAATVTGSSDSDVRAAVYFAVAALLTALAVLTATTGARTSVIWFKIRPVLLSSSAIILVVAGLL